MATEPGAMRVIVILAHPDIAHSRANKALCDAVAGVDGVAVHDLYRAYPDWRIDVAREQDLIKSANAIVFQFPFYWYSAPALLKEWEDKVLLRGFAFGTGGTALAGKQLLVATTTGAPHSAYSHGGRNRYELRELLLPFEASANLCGMRYLPPFSLSGVRDLSDADLAKASLEYRSRIVSLRDSANL